MAFEQKQNSGALFKNEKRITKNHPNMTGKASVGGIEYWVSAWTKAKPNGEKYMSLAFTEKDAQKSAPSKDRAPAPQTSMEKDDIPF